MTASSEADLEEELRRQCADLEQKLRQDDLSLQNETLEVQLVQMQDDFESLKKDFTSMCGFLERQLSEKTEHLEEQKRLATSAEGHADTLNDLLHFHEDNGQLISSYWRAQCEKRDGSIRFLTLKLKEYTVPSSEYWAKREACLEPDSEPEFELIEGDATSPEPPFHRRARANSDQSDAHATSSSAPANPLYSPPRQPSPPAPILSAFIPAAAGASDSSASPSIGQSYQTLLEQHRDLMRQHQELEDETMSLMQEQEASELSRVARQAHQASLSARQDSARPLEDSRHAAALEASLEAECSRLRSETEACEQSLAAACDRATAAGHRGKTPSWAQRCVWRDELDVRAGQLERISLQFDATKRSLDAANEELQWQATSAEALRVRLADVLRLIQTEEAKTSELREEHRQSQSEVEELVKQWPARDSGMPTMPTEVEASPNYRGLPLVFQRAHWLLETIRQGSRSRRESPGELWTAAAAVDITGTASAARLPEQAHAGSVRLTTL